MAVPCPEVNREGEVEKMPVTHEFHAGRKKFYVVFIAPSIKIIAKKTSPYPLKQQYRGPVEIGIGNRENIVGFHRNVFGEKQAMIAARKQDAATIVPLVYLLPLITTIEPDAMMLKQAGQVTA